MVIEARNYTKIRVLLYLRRVASEAISSELGEHWAWQAPAVIALYTNTNAASLYTILKRWRSNTWGYVDAKYFEPEQMQDGRPHWLYKINAKGQAYLDRLHKWYKAEAEVKAELEKDWLEVHDGILLPWRNLSIRGIAWHIKPSESATCIRWPFKTRHDAHIIYAFGGSYRVSDIQEAVYMARTVFHIPPSDECLMEARSLQDKYVRDALIKQAKAAGLEAR